VDAVTIESVIASQAFWRLSPAWTLRVEGPTSKWLSPSWAVGLPPADFPAAEFEWSRAVSFDAVIEGLIVTDRPGKTFFGLTEDEHKKSRTQPLVELRLSLAAIVDGRLCMSKTNSIELAL
jgi:hypothetical protein